MKQVIKIALQTITILISLTSVAAQAQKSETENGELIIHGGWLFGNLNSGFPS